MTAAEWSVGAAGPILRLLADPPDAHTRWQDFARCREFDGDLWFMEPGESGYGQAKAICAQCPVRHPCLEYALSIETRSLAHGVYGGLAPEERKAILRARHRLARQRRKAAA